MGEHQSNGTALAHKGPTVLHPLDVYRVLICAMGLVEPTTRLVSYINVHEMWTLPENALGQYMQFQVHVSAFGVGEYETRLIWVAEDGTTSPAGDQTDKVVVDRPDKRLAIQAPVVRVPNAPGLWLLTLEWRHPGDVWHRDGARCPIKVVLSAAPEVQPAPTAQA